jgi:hypothetical protein
MIAESCPAKSSIEFRERMVATSDLTADSSTVTSVSFVGRWSREWAEIGQRLAALPQLKTLFAEHCDSADNFFTGICSSKSVVSLRMGKWHVTQRNVTSLTKVSDNYAKCSN